MPFQNYDLIRDSLAVDAARFTESHGNDTIVEEQADVAQLVEQLIRNQQVVSSSLTVGSISAWRSSRHSPQENALTRQAGILRLSP